ncbi:riboflavin kinase-like [Cephus cinctus]|uniref:riboflavin kinase n=1 Tax=Cephus cinctus TaxID=211228 RepID=A0AAJ7BJU7_CEPCN|nr:riboflavin kinase-like [Cephus cinctus]
MNNNKLASPHFVVGSIVKGFQRGSKELGIPTANLPQEVIDALPTELELGVYYGWASLNKKDIYKMVLNVGWNPFYNNTKKSLEVHILHKFPHDLYGQEIRLVILGYIRPEMNFSCVDDLIREIKNDISIADKELEKQDVGGYKQNVFLKGIEPQHL